MAAWMRRHLWRLAATGLVGVTTWDGLAYSLDGDASARASYLAVLRAFPGGMRTHGIALLILAALLTVGIVRLGRPAWVALSGTVAYGVWATTAIAWSALTTREVVWGAPSKWMLTSWLAAVLVGTVPPRSSGGRARGGP